jgi:UDP-N-acetylglucosamine 2-epimerase (non-hydrolysing)
MKVAPVYCALREKHISQQTIVHTGQHYDANMSDIFFGELGIPRPDINLQVGSGSHAKQTATAMDRLETVIVERRPDLVLLYGDVNSTMAASLVCAKLQVEVAHVEAGLRSFDRRMPEEINRIVTDRLSNLLFTPSQDGDENLLREGIRPESIFFVGNVMIDTLVRLLPFARNRFDDLAASYGLRQYGLVTLHRPSTVDDDGVLHPILSALQKISDDLPLIFPIHPRTRSRLQSAATLPNHRIQFVDPLGYLDFLALQQAARVVITDSGGVQEETTFLGVPCLTMRENTERPVTLSLGTNTLVGLNTERLKKEVQRVLDGSSKVGQVPPLWDGNASRRIAQIVADEAWRYPPGAVEVVGVHN